jgi:hypothetical protein
MIRLIRTTIVEYEPNKEYYPEGFTLVDIAKIDGGADDAEFNIFCGGTGKKTEKIEYEIIDNNMIIDRGTVDT